jgi:hypothetical protein
VPQAVSFAPSESVFRGTQAVVTPCSDARALPWSGTAWRPFQTRATSVLAGTPVVRVPASPGLLTRLGLPLITGLRPPSPQPAKRPPPHHRVRPEPIPTQARASVTGVSSTGQQVYTMFSMNGFVLYQSCALIDMSYAHVYQGT